MKKFLLSGVLLFFPLSLFAANSLVIINYVQEPTFFRVLNAAHDLNESEKYIYSADSLATGADKIEGSTYYLSFKCAHMDTISSNKIFVVFDTIEGIKSVSGSCKVEDYTSVHVVAAPHWDGKPFSEIWIEKISG